MTKKDILRQAWRRLRASQPFNRWATHLSRSLLPESAFKTKLSEHLPYLGVVSLPLPNGDTLKLQSHGDDYTVNQIFWTRQYEPEVTPLFFQLAGEPGCVIDIGAHVGTYALLAAYANPNNRIFAFEPFSPIYHRLQENIALNGLGHIQSVLSAVGSRVGQIEFFHVDSPYLPSNSSTRKQTFAQSGKAFQSEMVPVTTLDQFCSEQSISKISLIKMDTEGTELEVLRGATEILKRDHPPVICEVLEHLGDPQGLEDLLRPLGYHFFRLEANGPRAQDHIRPHPTWWNYLFKV